MLGPPIQPPQLNPSDSSGALRYVESAEISGTAVPVYSLDIAGRMIQTRHEHIITRAINRGTASPPNAKFKIQAPKPYILSPTRNGPCILRAKIISNIMVPYWLNDHGLPYLKWTSTNNIANYFGPCSGSVDLPCISHHPGLVELAAAMQSPPVG